jgi:hypothetical protein
MSFKKRKYTKRHPRWQCNYIPSQKEIAEKCAEIRASWSPRVRRLRTADDRAYPKLYELPTAHEDYDFACWCERMGLR